MTLGYLKINNLKTQSSILFVKLKIPEGKKEKMNLSTIKKK